MRYPKEHVEKYRRSAGDLENDLIDEFNAGRVDRREFLVRGSVLGLGATLTTLIAFGPEAAFAQTPAVSRRRTGGTIRVGGVPADGSLEPPLLQSLGALAISHMAGEQLVYTDVHAKVQPQLATSWTPSDSAKTWTFKLRTDAKFHDGAPMTADDVVATFERLTGPNSQALSSLGGVLSPGGTSKVDACDGEVRPRSRQRHLPVPARRHDLPGDHPAEDLPDARRSHEARRLDVAHERHRAVQAQGEPRPGRATRSSPTTHTGAASRASTRSSTRSSRTPRASPRCAAARSISRCRSATTARASSAAPRRSCRSARPTTASST